VDAKPLRRGAAPRGRGSELRQGQFCHAFENSATRSAPSCGSHPPDHPRIDAEASRQARAVIARQVDHLARLTDDLLDAGRAVMGKIVLERRPIDLAALVARALATFQSAGRFGAHRLERSLDSVWVDADETRIEQIVANLVGNALKFTPAGGTVRVSVGHPGDDAVLAVSDTGVGMSEELRRASSSSSSRATRRSTAAKAASASASPWCAGSPSSMAARRARRATGRARAHRSPCACPP
jgi:signal transduction histidine kinase